MCIENIPTGYANRGKIGCSQLIARVASDETLDSAFDWLCKRRQDYSHRSDIWDFRQGWTDIKPALQQTLLSGEYEFDVLREIRTGTDVIDLWSAKDALVLKALAYILGDHLDPVISESCHHVKGRGGAKAAVRKVMSAVSAGSHVMKSDVKGYYASIDHVVMFDLAEEYIDDPFVLRLIWNYLRRTVCFGENYREVTCGISLGCPLSPLMGALYLKPLDDAVGTAGLFYARFMDDWVIIVPGRWKLRKIVRTVNRVLSHLRIEKHPDKTFIGRTIRGFDFLGYRVKPCVLSVSRSTINRHIERIDRLYEQDACYRRIRQYVRRWFDWLKAVVGPGVCFDLSFERLSDQHPAPYISL